MKCHQVMFSNFDTINTIILFDRPELLEQAQRACQQYEEKFNRFREGSDIWKLNHARGMPVTVSAETAELIKMAVRYAEETNGVFDITVGAVTEMWDFFSEKSIQPDQNELYKRAKEAGSAKICVDRETVSIPFYMQLDLGGIAKGYIADKVSEMLQREGIKSGIINLGGNICTIGNRPDGSGWQIGIQKPVHDTSEYSEVISVTQKAISTSGIYERGYNEDGVWRHHVLDTKTGMPIENELASVSVICDSSIEADVYSTAILCLGSDKGRALLSDKDGMSVFVQRRNGINEWLCEPVKI